MTKSDQRLRATQLLEAVNNNESTAADQLFSLLYDELRQMASAEMHKESPGITLQPTALVHEVWIKLLGKDQDQHWESKRHFFVAAAQAMRRILVDAARARTRKKRGGEKRKVQLTDFEVEQIAQDQELIDLDEALSILKEVSPEKGTLVELRYFAGLTNSEAAKFLNISTATAERYWVFAKTWLRKKMN